MTPTITLLMTRPPAASKRFVAQLPDHVRAQLNICYAPLIRIVPMVKQIALGDAGGLIFTSINAVEVASARIKPRELPVFCVGRATRQAAIDAGWTAEFAGATADVLIDTLLDKRPKGPILHLSGIHTRVAIAERLTAAGIKTSALAIYDQVVERLSPEAVALLNGSLPVIAPLFSPRTARQFAGQVQGAAPLWLAALSLEVSKPLKSLNFNKLLVCDRPDSETMCVLIENLVNDVHRVERATRAQ